MNKDYKTLEELKEELKDKFDEFMYKSNIELLTKIDKAVEFIESYNLPKDLKGMGEAPITSNDLNTLLDILRGKDER